MKIEKMPYFSNEKRYCKNSNGFELQEPRGTVSEEKQIHSFRHWWVLN